MAVDADAVIKRVRRVSRLMAGLCLFGMVALPAGLVWLWANPVWLADAYPAARLHMGDPANWPSYIPFAGFALTLGPASVLIYGLDQLRRLFRLYASGEIFSPEAARRLKRFAVAVMLQFLLRPLTGAALSVLFTAHNPPGQRAIAISFGSPEFTALLLGGLILVIAWIMGESARIADENKSFN
jgi:hypothetical protein